MKTSLMTRTQRAFVSSLAPTMFSPPSRTVLAHTLTISCTVSGTARPTGRAIWCASRPSPTLRIW
ncbi:hypothetical protein B0H10DRAFT_2026544 [Mycena sp. CBHHK59/15]|nr:hypothetical protein B0H10DRAFT_2026544 [Mycena sp. CBHHK59/15]